MTELPDAAAEWSLSRRVPAGGVEVRFRQAGSGRPVVLVHGLGVSADYWWRTGPRLAALGFRVLAPDLPGFGRTRGPRLGLSVPEQAAALREWARIMGIGPAAYVGHSLGAQAVLDLAARAPEAVTALVLASPTGAPGVRGHLRQAFGFLADVALEPPKLIPFVAEAYLRAGLVRWAATWVRAQADDPFGDAARVRVPSLVVLGTRDPVVPGWYARRLAARLPAGPVVRIPRAAHAVIFSQPEVFCRVVGDFLFSAAQGLMGAAARIDVSAPP